MCAAGCVIVMDLCTYAAVNVDNSNNDFKFNRLYVIFNVFVPTRFNENMKNIIRVRLVYVKQ